LIPQQKRYYRKKAQYLESGEVRGYADLHKLIQDTGFDNTVPCIFRKNRR
jgi:hypothetical protein